MRNLYRKAALLGWLILITAYSNSQVVRVTMGGGDTPPHDGSNWKNKAYSAAELQTAINAAGAGNSVWVAKGTYYPTTGTDRTVSIIIPTNGINLYGGFFGDDALEPPTYDVRTRDFKHNITILSGDIDNNDAVTTDGRYINYSNNSYHIIKATAITAPVVIDGFTINAGNGNDQNGAGGITNFGGGGNLSISNCILINNFQGAMFNLADPGNSCSPQITNCLFINNCSTGVGGAVTNSGITTGICTPAFTNCLFYLNHPLNSSPNYGGAVYQDAETGMGTVSCSFNNCTFYSNSGNPQGNSIIYNNSAVHTLVTFINCILWNNTTDGSSGISSGNLAITQKITTIFNSDVQNLTSLGTLLSSGGNISTDPLFTNPVAPIGTDSIWATSDDGFTLQCQSPALASGATALPSGITLPVGVVFPPANDLTGAARLDASGKINMGAYESSGRSLIATISTTSTTSICSGSTVEISFQGTPGAMVTYNANGGPNATIALDATTGKAVLTSPALSSNTTYNLVSITSSSCTQSANGSVMITVSTTCGSYNPCPCFNSPPIVQCSIWKMWHICWWHCWINWSCILFKLIILIIYFTGAITAWLELMARINGGDPGPLSQLWNFLVNFF